MIPGLGLSELLIITFLVLILVRTEDLPKIMRLFGKFWAKGHRYFLLFKQEILRAERSMRIDEEIKNIRSINNRLNEEISSFGRELENENKNTEKRYSDEMEKQTEFESEKEK
jgi:Sec-independent protein translocase protein TatA